MDSNETDSSEITSKQESEATIKTKNHVAAGIKSDAAAPTSQFIYFFYFLRQCVRV